MAVDQFDAPFALIVNLDSYTGNFEREFCAYVTGAYGECEVGKNMAKLFSEEHPGEAIIDIVYHQMDDGGCRRPVSIYHDTTIDVTPYESLIIFFECRPEDHELALIQERARKFCAERPDWKPTRKRVPYTIKGMRLIENKVVRTQETIWQTDAKSC